MSEHVYGWLEFLDDVCDCVVMFEFFLDDDAKEFGVGVLAEFGSVDVEL